MLLFTVQMLLRLLLRLLQLALALVARWRNGTYSPNAQINGICTLPARISLQHRMRLHHRSCNSRRTADGLNR